MRAAWWWIDRWRQSRAYTDMTAEEQGLYRNLCDEVWLRENHIIPDDPRILSRVSGDPEAWIRCGAKVLLWMKRVEGGWTHKTAVEVIGQSRLRADKQSRYRERMRNSQGNAVGNKASNTEGSPSPSPSPSLISVSVPVSDQRKNKLTSKALAVDTPKNGSNGNGHVNGRSRRPVFSGQRFVVFDWMLEDLSRTLGSHTEAFDLHEWFFQIDALAVKQAGVIAKEDQWPWLQRALMAEVEKRGLPISSAPAQLDKRTQDNLAAAKRFAARKAH